MKKPKQDKVQYNHVMILYLLTGGAGLLFAGGNELDKLGWLDNIVGYIFGDYAKAVLDGLYTVSVIATFALGFSMLASWIVAIILIFKFRMSWRVVVPAALLLLSAALMIFQSENFDSVMLGAFTLLLYFLAAFLIGMEWFIKGRK